MLKKTRDDVRRRVIDRTEISVRPFVRPIVVAVLVAVCVFVVWRLSDVIVLAFGAALLAILLRGLAGALSRHARIPAAWAVAPIVIGLFVAVGSVAWFFGSQIAAQFVILAKDLPQSASQLARDLGASPSGAWFLDQLRSMSLTSATGQLAGYITTLFRSVFRVIAYVAVLLFAAVYLASQPERYRRGLLWLVPRERRRRIGEVLDLMGTTLRRWLIGQSITMVVVGTLAAIGLWALGIAAPLALGLIAGMFAFIPYVGPILASAPGILIAAARGPMTAIYAAALYGGIHLMESNLITPLIQAEAVELPPVLTVFATLIFGLLLGPLGVLLAAPLTVVLLVAVNALYLEDILGEHRVWPSRRDGKHRE